jgi:uncharacterized protein (TIGR00369 family)
MGTRWYAREDGSVVTEVTLTDEQQGPPRHAHGGASTALLDEAMGAAVWQAGFMVAAVHLSVDFQRPLPLGVPVQVVGAVSGKEGRKVHTWGEIRLPDGAVAVSCTGIFVEAGHLFADHLETYVAARQK